MATGRSKPIPAFNEYDSTEDCLHPIANLTMSPRRPDKQFGTSQFHISPYKGAHQQIDG